MATSFLLMLMSIFFLNRPIKGIQGLTREITVALVAPHLSLVYVYLKFFFLAVFFPFCESNNSLSEAELNYRKLAPPPSSARVGFCSASQSRDISCRFRLLLSFLFKLEPLVLLFFDY